MSRMLRSCARRLHRSGRSAIAPQAASGRLRERVLGAVRSEAADGGIRARRPSLQSLAVIAATATVTAAIAVAFAVSRSPSAQSPARGVQHAAGANAARASLHYNGDRAELVVSGMPEPPIGEVYELWLNRTGAAPHPTDALFMVTSAGNGSVEVPDNLRGVREVMVTSEPLGGSSAPTSLAVLRVRVPRAR
jgi:hypothetical protein